MGNETQPAMTLTCGHIPLYTNSLKCILMDSPFVSHWPKYTFLKEQSPFGFRVNMIRGQLPCIFYITH